MADKKISELNAATALQGDEKIAVVQSSETKYAEIKDIVNYIVPTSLTVSSGQTVDLNSSTYEDSEMIKLSWSGGAGSMTLTLPDATTANNTYRIMRFISNGGFDVSTRAHLSPRAGQTLDGSSAYYEINKAFEGITVWSDGINWYIIQAKA